MSISHNTRRSGPARAHDAGGPTTAAPSSYGNWIPMKLAWAGATAARTETAETRAADIVGGCWGTEFVRTGGVGGWLSLRPWSGGRSRASSRWSRGRGAPCPRPPTVAAAAAAAAATASHDQQTSPSTNATRPSTLVGFFNHLLSFVIAVGPLPFHAAPLWQTWESSDVSGKECGPAPQRRPRVSSGEEGGLPRPLLGPPRLPSPATQGPAPETGACARVGPALGRPAIVRATRG